jgi:rhomboid family protein
MRRSPAAWQALRVVIPVHDENPLRRTPWVTYLLIAVNVAVFVLFTPGALPRAGTQAAVTCQQQAFYDRYGAIPHEMLTGQPLRLVPTGQAVLTAQGEACAVSRPAYRKTPALSVLEAMFVHSGWLHLLGNMLFLLIFGNNVEDRLRRLPYLLFYLACGYVAAYGYALVNPGATGPLVGASGAISGVLGAYLVLFPRARVWSLVPFLLFIPLRIPAWLVLGLWFVLQWAYAAGQLTGGGTVAYVAHVFGFLAGMLGGLLLRAAAGRPRAA